MLLYFDANYKMIREKYAEKKKWESNVRSAGSLKKLVVCVIFSAIWKILFNFKIFICPDSRLIFVIVEYVSGLIFKRLKKSKVTK